MKKYNGKRWVSELSDHAIKMLIDEYRKILDDMNCYSTLDLADVLNDLENEKLRNIKDSVGVEFLENLSKL